MDKLSIGEIEKAVQGILLTGDRNAAVTGVSTDSRTVAKGDIFFPLKGENFDAHQFLPQVFLSGCDTVIVARELEEVEESIKEAFEKESEPGCIDRKKLNIIKVNDTTAALQELARYYLSKFDIKKIAVTGSTGKTTTRDMLYFICSEKYKTARNKKNYNNNIGLPLTVLSLTKGVEVAVLEMGMDAFGEIDFLADLVKPDIGIITNVRTAHIEKLGSRENIFKAKMEITNHFSPGNVLVINEDGDLLTRRSAAGNYKLITTGCTGKSDYIISDVQDFGDEGIEFVLEHEGRTQHFKLNVPGRHNAENAAEAVAAAGQIGITMKEAAAGLAKMELTEKRLNIKGKNGIKVIDDTYNAAPDSMRAAIDVLIATKGMRKVAILGDMGELGSEAEKYHRIVGAYAADRGVNLLITIGNNSRYLSDEAGKKGVTVFHFKDKEGFYAQMRKLISPGDVILAKGSRIMAMDQVVKKLLD